MKRRHSREMAISFCNKVLAIRKDATFGADLIAGFPTETHKMFKDTLSLVDECHLTHLHVFPYSTRANTPAALMPQVDKSVIKDRANILRQKGIEKLKKYLENKVGEKDLILIEKNQNEKSIGKDQNFFNVMLDEKIREGEIVPCVYVGVNNDILMAKRI
jgi:2-methylthioadenine synthetase